MHTIPGSLSLALSTRTTRTITPASSNNTSSSNTALARLYLFKPPFLKNIKHNVPGANPGFLERAFICIRGRGRFADFSLIFPKFGLTETKLFHFHRILKTWGGGGGGQRGGSGEPLNPRGGGVLRYFHTYVGSGHYWGFKILNFNFFFFFFFLGGGGGGVRKMNIFGGMKILWIIFFWGGGGGANAKLDYI